MWLKILERAAEGEEHALAVPHKSNCAACFCRDHITCWWDDGSLSLNNAIRTGRLRTPIQASGFAIKATLLWYWRARLIMIIRLRLYLKQETLPDRLGGFEGLSRVADRKARLANVGFSVTSGVCALSATWTDPSDECSRWCIVGLAYVRERLSWKSTESAPEGLNGSEFCSEIQPRLTIRFCMYTDVYTEVSRYSFDNSTCIFESVPSV